MNYKELINKLVKVTKILRIFDDKGLVSLTNITMMVVIYKLASTPAMSFTDITALGLGVLSYQAKRVIEK